MICKTSSGGRRVPIVMHQSRPSLTTVIPHVISPRFIQDGNDDTLAEVVAYDPSSNMDVGLRTQISTCRLIDLRHSWTFCFINGFPNAIPTFN